MVKSNDLPRPTDAELEILTVLWSRDRPRPRRAFHYFPPPPGALHHGLKLMQIMTDKGS